MTQMQKRINLYASRLRGDSVRRATRLATIQKFSRALEASRKCFPNTAETLASTSKGNETNSTESPENLETEIVDEAPETSIGVAISSLSDLTD